jgi:hypothetical protein
MNVHANRNPFFDKNLFKEHPSNFTCLNISVRYKVSVGSVGAGPAETEALFLGRPWLNENVSLPWNFRLDTTAKGLVKHVEKRYRTGEWIPTVIVSHKSA